MLLEPRQIDWPFGRAAHRRGNVSGVELEVEPLARKAHARAAPLQAHHVAERFDSRVEIQPAALGKLLVARLQRDLDDRLALEVVRFQKPGCKDQAFDRGRDLRPQVTPAGVFSGFGTQDQKGGFRTRSDGSWTAPVITRF